MKLPSDETPDPTNGDGYLSDEYDQIEMMPAPIRDGDFSEYEWMEHEEEFDSQVLFSTIRNHDCFRISNILASNNL